MFDFDNLREIFGTMKRNKLRTFLTGFAVSWGIFILIILLGAGNGLRNGVMKNFENWSQNRIVIYAGSTDKPYAGFQRGRRIRFTYKDFEDLSVFFPEIDKKTVEQYLSDTLKYNNEYSVVSLRGVHPAKAEIDFLKMNVGKSVRPGRTVTKDQVFTPEQLAEAEAIEEAASTPKKRRKRISEGQEDWDTKGDEELDIDALLKDMEFADEEEELEGNEVSEPESEQAGHGVREIEVRGPEAKSEEEEAEADGKESNSLASEDEDSEEEEGKEAEDSKEE